MGKQKLLCLLFLLALPLLSGRAQQRLKFEVADFHKNAFDMTARGEKGKTDSNGDRYAIIKVTSDIENDDIGKFHFDFGNMNSFDEVKDDLGELWVYVQRNAKRATISRDGYTTVKFNLPETIEAGSTYVLKLIVHTPNVERRVMQFTVTPANEGALVKVKPKGAEGEYELWGTVDASGSIDQLKEVGVYQYEVVAENYETCEGEIVLTNGSDNYVENVTLKPNFGWLEIQDTYGIAGAKIYVDNKPLGTVPYKSNDRWEARDGYQLMISAGELYKTYYETFSIRKGEVTKLAPRLESNFANTTLKVDGDAEADIYVDNTRRGTGSWSGPLKAGTYTVECRHANHQSTTRQIVVKPDQEETFLLSAPVPITGSVYVTTQPTGARIFLDGTEKGVSPANLKNVIIGQHRIKVMLDNYKTEEQQVEVKENSTTKAGFELRDFARFTINSQPQARLTLNGEDKGMTPYSFEGASGEYDIRLTQRKYKTYHQRTMLRSSDPEQTLRLKRQYQRPFSGYIQGSLQAGTFMAFGGHIGAYLYNINIEGFYNMGLQKETFFFNYTDDTAPKTQSIKATSFGGKVGYGIVIGTRLRITPQVGMVYIYTDTPYIDATAWAATVGARVDYALTSFLGVTLAPEGQFAIKKGEVFSQLSSLSSKVKKWGTGAGVRVGIYFYF